MIEVRRTPLSIEFRARCDSCGRRSRTRIHPEPGDTVSEAQLALHGAVRLREQWWIAAGRALCRTCWRGISLEARADG